MPEVNPKRDYRECCAAFPIVEVVAFDDRVVITGANDHRNGASLGLTWDAATEVCAELLKLLRKKHNEDSPCRK